MRIEEEAAPTGGCSIMISAAQHCVPIQCLKSKACNPSSAFKKVLLTKKVLPHSFSYMHGPPCLGTAVQETVEEMCKVSERPMILALSNPTSQAEITAEDAIHFSKGKAMFMSGSFRHLCSLYLSPPFPP